MKNTLPIIQLRNLQWKYGSKMILNNITLNIEKGKFYSIIGPNGSGKTTLLKTIAKILEPQKDMIWIEEIDLVKLSRRDLSKKMASVPQSTEVNFEFSCREIVMMGRAPYLKRFETEGRKDIEIVKEAMEMTNTWELRNKSIRELSGGERQRVIVARAIAQQPELLLLDEPISHLDIHHQIRLLNQIRTFNQQRKFTVIAVLHDLNLSARYSDELILLHEGEIISFGIPEEVLTRENIKKVYGMEVDMIKNPKDGKPYILI